MTKISVTVGNEFAALVSLKRGDQICNCLQSVGIFKVALVHLGDDEMVISLMSFCNYMTSFCNNVIIGKNCRYAVTMTAYIQCPARTFQI